MRHCASRTAGRAALAAGAMLLLGGVPAASAQDEAAWDAFHARLAQCTKTHRYDPDATLSYGKHEIAPGEREWRACAYAGVREILMPAASRKEPYERIIVQDKVMTDKVERGEMTRSERRERLHKLIAQIREQEEAAAMQRLDASKAEFESRMGELSRMRDLERMHR